MLNGEQHLSGSNTAGAASCPLFANYIEHLALHIMQIIIHIITLHFTLCKLYNFTFQEHQAALYLQRAAILVQIILKFVFCILHVCIVPLYKLYFTIYVINLQYASTLHVQCMSVQIVIAQCVHIRVNVLLLLLECV